MLTDRTALARFALALLSTMFADLAAAALLALALLSAVLAEGAAAARLAPVLDAVVRAEDFSMAVPAHCTAALRIAAAAAATIAVAGASASASTAAAAADGGTGVTLQPVDQILLLPADRQSKLGAELLQRRDGLRVRKTPPANASQSFWTGHRISKSRAQASA
jgi:hypothetical protein